jgi:hypothetical protein
MPAVKAAALVIYLGIIAGAVYLAGGVTRWTGALLGNQWLIDLADPSKTRPDFLLGMLLGYLIAQSTKKG